jgi:hypothetical protein
VREDETSRTCAERRILACLERAARNRSGDKVRASDEGRASNEGDPLGGVGRAGQRQRDGE